MINETAKGGGIMSILFRAVRVVIVLGIAVALAAFLVKLKKEPEKKEMAISPPGVKVVKVFPVSKVMSVETFGTIKPRKLVKIAVEVPGRIVYLNPSFTEGGAVKKDEVLIRIDPRSFKLDSQTGLARIKQAKADIENLRQEMANLENDLVLSKKNVALAGKERDRINSLSQNDFASKNTLDRAEQQYLQARIALQGVKNRLASAHTLLDVKQAALELAQADWGKAKLALEKSCVTAPFDGFILDKYAETMEFVNPGQVIGSIYQKDSLDVDVRIPMEKIKWIKSLLTNGTLPMAKVEMANFDHIESHIWDAKVVRIKARVDEKTRTLPMTLEILKTEEPVKGVLDLKPGSFVKCTILGEKIEKIYVLPRYLMKTGDVFYTVEKDRLVIKKVEILRKFEDEIYIQSGLKPGEMIVASPLPGAVDGMAVAIMVNGDK